MDRTAPADPYAPPAPLEVIVADLRDIGIRPTPLNVIRAAVERGAGDDEAAALAGQIERAGLAAPLAMAERMAERRGEHRR